MQPEPYRIVAYISGPYRAPTAWQRQENIRRAMAVALDCWKMGYATICPHGSTANMDGELPDEAWLQGDLAILARCDLVVLVPGWRESAGARAEVAEALRQEIPVYEWAGPGELIPLDESSSQEVRVGQVCRKTQQPAQQSVD